MSADFTVAKTIGCAPVLRRLAGCRRRRCARPPTRVDERNRVPLERDARKVRQERAAQRLGGDSGAVRDEVCGAAGSSLACCERRRGRCVDALLPSSGRVPNLLKDWTFLSRFRQQRIADIVALKGCAVRAAAARATSPSVVTLRGEPCRVAVRGMDLAYRSTCGSRTSYVRRRPHMPNAGDSTGDRAWWTAAAMK